MGLLELFLVAVGLSMDAFAVALCSGLAMQKATFKKALIVGLYFGLFQGFMPLIGYLLASQFSHAISDLDHWVAFILLSFIGGKMLWDGIKESRAGDGPAQKQETSLKPADMLPLAIATSIDAMAVGISFAFMRIQIIPAISFIGIVTLLFSMAGVKLGHAFGSRLEAKATVIGGIILILIGLKILLEHLGVF